MVKTVDDINVKDKKVIVRVGFDVPLNEAGEVVDDSRIRESMATITSLMKSGAKQIILMCHIGRPSMRDPRLTTDNVAKRVSEIVGKPVRKIDDWGEKGIPSEQIIFLENLRFNSAEKDSDVAVRDRFGRSLANLADIYVNDAFSNSHRDHASMTSVPKFIPGCIGLSVLKEINAIDSVLKDPERPMVCVIGGLKADKINAIRNLLDKADHVLVGGALAFLLLKKKGISVGASKIDDEGLKEGIRDVLDNKKLLLPTDAVIADEFSKDANSKTVSVNEIEDDWMALDIGPETVVRYKEVLSKAKTILWNGPIGVFEMDKFASGTKMIAEAIAKSSARSILGGGDSEAAVKKFGFDHDITHISTGGGASLTLIEGKELVAVKVLS